MKTAQEWQKDFELFGFPDGLAIYVTAIQRDALDAAYAACLAKGFEFDERATYDPDDAESAVFESRAAGCAFAARAIRDLMPKETP